MKQAKNDNNSTYSKTHKKLVIAENRASGRRLPPLWARMKSAADILRAAATLCRGVSGI